MVCSVIKNGICFVVLYEIQQLLVIYCSKLEGDLTRLNIQMRNVNQFSKGTNKPHNGHIGQGRR